MAATNTVSLDQNSCGSNLALSIANSVLMTSAIAVDGHRMCRSQYGLGSGTDVGSVQFYVYTSTGAITAPPVPVSTDLKCTVGVVDNSASTAKGVGEDAHGWGYCPANGKVYNNGAVLATFATCAFGDYITMRWNAVDGTLSFFKNADLLGSVTLSAGTYYYAATVSGDQGDLAVWANAGQNLFRWGFKSAGWFHVSTGIVPLYLAQEPAITAPTDTAPNLAYDGALDRTDQTPISVSRGFDFWFWGASKPQAMSGAQIVVPIDDPKQVYGQLMTLDIRDQRIIVTRNNAGNAAAVAEMIGHGILDRCDQPTDQTKTLYAHTKIALLGSQLLRPLFPPDADPTLAWKPWPMRKGICRNFTPACYDSKKLYFAVTDTPVTAIGKARDGGKEISYSIDYSLLPDGQNINRKAAPSAKFQLETTTYGGAFTTSYADQLNGDGTFTSLANADGGGVTGTSTSTVANGTGSKSLTVTGFGVLKKFVAGSPITLTGNGGTRSVTGTVTSYNTGTGALVVNATSSSGTAGNMATPITITAGVNQPHNTVGGGGYPNSAPGNVWQLLGSSPNKYVEVQQTADADFWLQFPAYNVPAGATIAFEVVVKQAPYYGPAPDSQNNPSIISPAQLCFSGFASHTQQFMAWTKFAIPSANTYRGSFTNTQSTALPLVFGFLANNLIQGSGGITTALQISSIRIVPLQALTTNVSLQGPGLDQLLKEILIEHGTLQPGDYDSTGALAIDAATGYQYGIPYSENETPTIADAAQALLDSCGACLYENRAGSLTAYQLTPPEKQVAIGSLTETDFNGYLTPSQDLAEGLTARAVGTRNINPSVDSDFANASQTEVPTIVRNQLKAPYQTTCIAGVNLPTRYRFANNANPLKTCLDLPAHVQAEITRVNAMYAPTPRNFYTGQVFTPYGRLINPGEVYFVTYPTGNLIAGQNLVVVWTTEEPTEELTTVVFWGL
jgi:hypothetical protein